MSNFGIYRIPILILALIAGRADAESTASGQEMRVTVCDLVGNPSEYADQKVELTAILASGEEFSMLEDDACPPKLNPNSRKTDLLEASFSQSQYDFRSAMNKRLSKLLKKEQQAKVTVVGVFIDPGTYVGHQLCCRYRFEIQRLLSVKNVLK